MDFTKLSSEDLNEFLSQDYGLSVDKNLSATEQAQQLFNYLQHRNVEFPYPVVDLYLASLYRGPRDKTYTYDQIMNLSSKEIDMFSKVLGFKSTDPSLDRDRIFRILTYLGLIDIKEELIQPHILDYLCRTLSVDDLNNYRLANNLDKIDCQLNINYKGDYFNRGPKTFTELNDTTYRLIKLLEEHSYLDLFNHLIDTNDVKGLEYLLQTEFTPPREIIRKIVQTGRLNLVQLLVEYGVNPSGLMNNAIYEEDLDMVRYLFESGAAASKSNWYSYAPLIWAAETGNLDIVKLLVEKGADINQTDEHGNTALVEAVTSGNFDLIKYLIENGIDPNIQNTYQSQDEINTNATALDVLRNASLHREIAKKYGDDRYNEIEEYLVNNGAKPGWKIYDEKMLSINPNYRVPF